tara:strand:- start:11932 stop:12153 length:222 start_codon:yes stop_codon:yes gene_type:complete
MSDEPNDLVERRTAADILSELAHAALYMRTEAATITTLQAENEHLQNLLNGRDRWLVDNGCWEAFVAQLPQKQ